MRKPAIPRIKKLPYFKSGSLVFADSGHVLGMSDRHYRCLKNTRKKCSANSEKQINTETLERAFSRYAKKFSIDKDSGRKMAQDILKKDLWEVITTLEEDVESKEEIMNATTVVMAQEAIANKKISKTDIKDFEDAFVQSNQTDYPLLLCGFVLNFIKVAMNPEKEAILGRNLAILTKEVRLSKDGRIVGLELEPWGWYTMNYINRYKPDYLKKLRESGVILTNTTNEVLELPLHEAALTYKIGHTAQAMGEDMTVIYGLFKFVKDMFGHCLEDDPEKMALAIPQMFNRMQNDPVLRIAIQSMAVLGMKPEPVSPPEKKS